MQNLSPLQLEEGKVAPSDQILENQSHDVQEGQDTMVPVTMVPTKSSSNIPYSVFSRGQKNTIVTIVALAGVASTLSANIYFPALNAIQAVSHVACGL
jgi:hypothetical protein